jgi:DNA polymerase epsilon subunit 2
LNHPETLNGLDKIFARCEDSGFIPKVVVLCGNFTSVGISQGNSRDIQQYQGDVMAMLLLHGPFLKQVF